MDAAPVIMYRLRWHVRRAWAWLVRGFKGDLPINPVSFVASRHAIRISAQSVCDPRLSVTIEPLDFTSGSRFRSYGPFDVDASYSGDLLERCCWAYMMEFPEVGMP